MRSSRPKRRRRSIGRVKARAPARVDQQPDRRGGRLRRMAAAGDHPFRRRPAEGGVSRRPSTQQRRSCWPAKPSSSGGPRWARPSEDGFLHDEWRVSTGDRLVYRRRPALGWRNSEPPRPPAAIADGGRALATMRLCRTGQRRPDRRAKEALAPFKTSGQARGGEPNRRCHRRALRRKRRQALRIHADAGMMATIRPAFAARRRMAAGAETLALLRT